MSQIGQYGSAAIAVLALAAFFAKGEQKKVLGNVLLLALTLFVGTFMTFALGGSGRMMKSNSAVGADTAEMGLRITSCLEWVEKFTESSVPRSLREQRNKHGSAEKEKARKQAYDRAEKSLTEAAKQKPENYGYKAKLAVVLLIDNEKAHHQEIIDLAHALQQNSSATTADKESYKELGRALELIASKSQIEKSEVPALQSALETTLPAGWYRNNCLLKLFEASGETEKLSRLENKVKDQYINVFFKLILVLSIVAVSAVIGLITMLVQIALIARRSEVRNAGVGLHLPWKTIYAVFISWFTCYILISMGFHQLVTAVPSITADPLKVALSTACTYLLSNLPAPFLIYYLALKPRDLPFWSTLGIVIRQPFQPNTEDDSPDSIPKRPAGPFKLIVFGYLAWCCAFPLVALAAFLASQLIGTQGSDNPVIAQIVQAANSSNPAAAAIFYLTLGVMAPFFEEMLFRGFLYGSIKAKLGAPIAILISSAMFACMHFDKGGMLMLFAIGFVLAYTYEKTRSLIPAMVAHGLWNSGTFTLALILFSSN